MNEYVVGLRNQYRSRGVVVDTNVLLLLFVGRCDPSLITEFTRTRKFGGDDYKSLCRFLKPFDRIVTTPHILSEVSNLSRGFEEPARTQYWESFGSKITSLSEEYVASATAAQMSCFRHLGLTDAGIMHLAHGAHLVLTDDLELSGRLAKAGVDVLNFNHLRPIF